METIILLFGVSNVGKTTTGRILADKLGVQFIDLDEEIKKKHKVTMEGFANMFPFAYSRAKEAGDLLTQIVNRQVSSAVVAVRPIYYARFFNTLLTRENIVAIDLQDSAEHVFERLVFTDENDEVIDDPFYKYERQKSYMSQLRRDIRDFKRAHKKIELKYNIDNKKPDDVAADLAALLERFLRS